MNVYRKIRRAMGRAVEAMHPMPVSELRTAWDDLLQGIDSPEDWSTKRPDVLARFNALLRQDAAPALPERIDVTVEMEKSVDDMTVRCVRWQAEPGDTVTAWVGLPRGEPPAGGWPGVVVMHGTTSWGARRTLGIEPEPGNPDAEDIRVGRDDARNLVRAGYVTLSPEHFCAGRRTPPQGAFDTTRFYKKHPDWSAAGKFTFENRQAVTVLQQMPQVNASRIGAMGHSLGGQGAIWLAALDPRVRCTVVNCAAGTFRENPNPWVWSRDHWYVYFPQLREQFKAGETVACDFHEMLALIAPRPVLEIFAVNDGCPATQQHRMTLHAKLAELYHLLDADAARACIVSGDGHSTPDLSLAATVCWMDRWLKHDGQPNPAWEHRPITV